MGGSDRDERPEERPLPRHEATDRFGKAALRTAHDLGRALADDPARGDEAAAEPVVVHRGGPHRSLAGLAALIDEALAENEEGGPGSAAPPPGDDGT